jgi:hypothetical protein
MTNKFPLFDKIINVYLRRSDGKTAEILCPKVGRKPTIRLSGEMVCNTLLHQLELRITNLVTDVPLSDYTHAPDKPPGSGGYVEIEAGYAGSLRTMMHGEVMNAFQETPGPDGVATFQCFVGSFTDWTTRTMTASFEEFTPVSVVMGGIASALGLSLIYHADPNLRIKCPISHNGLAKDLIQTVTDMFRGGGQYGDWSGLMVRPDGNSLIVTNKDIGTGLIYRLDYVSMVNHQAGGFSIQAPWIPSIRPADSVQIDPKFFRQDFGGQVVKAGNTFRVLTITFDFCTTDSTNMMTLQTVDEAAFDKSHTSATPVIVIEQSGGL